MSKQIASLPLDIQRTIVAKMDDHVAASQIRVQKPSLDTMHESVKEVLEDWDRSHTRWRAPKDKSDIVTLECVFEIKHEGYLSYKYDCTLVYHKKTNQIVHVSVLDSPSNHKYSYRIWWSSPQFEQPGGFHVDLYEHYQMRKRTGYTSTVYMKHWIYAFVIECQMNYPQIVTPEVYTHIMTRFRQKDLLLTYPPKVATAKSSKSSRLSMSSSRSASSKSPAAINLLENYKNMDGVLGYSEAVKALLKKPKTTDKSTKGKRIKRTVNK